MPNTVRLHRVLATKPDKVYRAFIEADAMAKWLPPNGFSCTVHHLDAKVGGTHRRAFPTLFRWRRAISAGRIRCEISPASSSPKSINSETGNRANVSFWRQKRTLSSERQIGKSTRLSRSRTHFA